MCNGAVMEKKVFRVILVLVVVLLCGYFLFGVVPSALIIPAVIIPTRL